MPSSNVGGGSESFMRCVRPATRRSVSPRAGLGSLVLALVVISGLAAAQTPPAAGGDITGVIKSGSMPLPGVTVSAANSLTGQKAVTSTAEDGSYALHLSANGRYVVRAEMAAFAAATHEVVINAENHSARVDLDLTLLSRVQQQQQQAAAQARRQAGGANRGFQSLPALQSEFGAGAGNGGFNNGEAAPSGLQVPGMSAESATESVSITGNTANANWSGLSSDQLRQRVQEMRDRQGGGYDTLGSSLYGGGQGPPGGQGTQGGGGGPGGQGAGPGGAGGRGPGGGGGFGGGGGGPFMLGGGRGRFNFNRPHGTI
ncbi:MAG: carboxypeptidase-like regulatory domain-containing protein [Terriglobales bacterium]